MPRRGCSPCCSPGATRTIRTPFPTGGTSKVPPAGAALFFTSGAWTHDRGSGTRALLDRRRRREPDPPHLLQHGERGLRQRDRVVRPRRQARGHDPGQGERERDLARLRRPHARSRSRSSPPAGTIVNGIDWARRATTSSPTAGSAMGGLEDLFRADPNGANTANLTSTATSARAEAAHRPRHEHRGLRAHRSRRQGRGLHLRDRAPSRRGSSPVGPGGAPLPGTPYLRGKRRRPGLLSRHGLPGLPAPDRGRRERARHLGHRDRARTTARSFVTLATGSALSRGARLGPRGHRVSPRSTRPRAPRSSS